jgi:hypothetical protein
LSKLSPVYDIESRKSASLAEYPTLDSLLVRLKARGKETAPARKALLCTLIDRNRTSPHELWSTILLSAFASVLRKMRRKLHCEDAETCDAIVLESFLETLTDVRTSDARRIFMYVRQRTRRRALRVLRERETWQTIGFGTEADETPDPNTLEEPRLHGVWLRDGVTMEGSAELLATVGDRGALLRLVQAQHPDLDRAGQARAFRCLQKRRDRLVSRLRSELGDKGLCEPPSRAAVAAFSKEVQL